VERPKHRRRSSRRTLEKTDFSDAEAAARAVLAGETSGVPKSGDGRVEMIRVLRAARRSAIKARTQAANQLQGLRVRAPEKLRRRLRGLSTKELVLVAARFRLADGPSDVPTATKFALRSVARRYEKRDPLGRDRRARRTPRSAGGASGPGVGLIAGHRYRPRRGASDRGRGQPPEVEERGLLRESLRSLSNRSFDLWQSRPASSQPRWQQGGQPCAVHDLSGSDETRSAHQGVRRSRRTAEGKSKREIIRCLKRYIAREAYRVLIS
jgi:transposase